MTGEDFKTCTKCGEAKPLDQFPRNGHAGYRADCKLCHSAQVRGIYHADVAASREKNKERQRRYFAEDPERIRERQRNTRQQNPEAHVADNVRWAQRNPEKVREYKRKWAEANPEAVRDRVRKRRARRKDAFVAEVRFDDILLRDMGVCGICSRPILDPLIELDHILPLAAGGTHEPNNVQIAHRSCNRRKAANPNYGPT